MKYILIFFFLLLIHYIVGHRLYYKKLYIITQNKLNKISQAEIIKEENINAKPLEQQISSNSSRRNFYLHRYYEVINKIKKYIKNNRNKKVIKILDIGCGDGYFLNLLSKKININYKLYGIDISHKRIKIAKKRLSNLKNNATLNISNAEKLSYKKNDFDIVISIENLEHLINPQESISEILRITKPGGLIIITTPSLHTTFLSYRDPFNIFNPLVWIESAISLLYKNILPPFHRLYRPKKHHTVIHRAFSIPFFKKLFSSQRVQITSSDFFFEEFYPSVIRKRLHYLIKKIPIINKMGRRLIVKLIKE